MEIYVLGCPRTQETKQNFRLYVSSVDIITFEGVAGSKDNLVGIFYV